MCIAIFTKENVVLPELILRNSAENNKDGCGVAFIDPNTTKINIYVTLDLEEFIQNYNDICKEAPDSPKLVHFRKQTKGTISLANCHPFHISEDMAFMHNGTISASELILDKDESDTAAFCSDFLQKLPEDWMENDAIVGLVKNFVGASRLVFLKSDGTYLIINETKERGHWNTEKNIWYSNYSYNKGISSIAWSNTVYNSNRSSNHRCNRNLPNDISYTLVPGTDDDWICSGCYRRHFSFTLSCRSCKKDKWKGFVDPDQTKFSSSRRERFGASSLNAKCPNCEVIQSLSNKTCCYCKADLIAKDSKKEEEKASTEAPSENFYTDCTFCGKNEEIVFWTTYQAVPIYLCRRCKSVLQRESEVFFPKHLFRENLALPAPTPTNFN